MIDYEELSPRVKMSIGTKDSSAVFGRGVAYLCKGVQEEGSLNKATKSMGMAYSKAWRVMKNTEESFGFDFIDRDGAHGSTLTPKGQQLFELYVTLQHDIEAYASKRLKELVAELEPIDE